MSKISEIDKNLAVSDTVSENGLIFRNSLSAPFSLYGLLPVTPFLRFPLETAKKVNPGVEGLCRNTAGGRLRFKTNSKRVVLRVCYDEISPMPHMPLTGSTGFDAYIAADGKYSYAGSFIPPINCGNNFDSEIVLPDNAMRDITINFPLYNSVKTVFIGLEESAELIKTDGYTDYKPIVYYGSSITQGGCASRPGNSYQALISRRFNLDYFNFGFSGSARGEKAMADYIADLNMSLFFLDYDHNSPDPEHLKAHHEKFFLTVREINPDLPVIMATKTDIPRSPDAERDTAARRRVVYETYENALKRGDRNVMFIDGGTVFTEALNLTAPADSCTVDGCHPNDLGFACMAKVYGDAIKNMLGLI